MNSVTLPYVVPGMRYYILFRGAEDVYQSPRQLLDEGYSGYCLYIRKKEEK